MPFEDSGHQERPSRPAGEDDWDNTVAEGLEKTYRQGRRLLRQVAAASESPDELWHELRKRVKDLGYQLALHKKIKGVKQQLAKLDEVGGALGDARDLSLLRNYLGKVQEKSELSAVERESYQRLLTRLNGWRQRLHRRALEVGQRVYRRGSKRFTRRMAKRWRQCVKDGNKFMFGQTIVTARHTPGHTPEHVSYLIAEKAHPDRPWGILTGDSLFVSSVGRPDLIGSGETEKLTNDLFHPLREFYLALPDGVSIYPAHGHGSPCGTDIGDRMESTSGYEREFNPFLQFSDFEKFKQHALSNAPPVPRYYPLMKKLNAHGPEVLGNLPHIAGLPPKAFKHAVEEKAGVLVDTRMMLAFGGGHIKGAFNIGGTPMLSIWAGWLLDLDEPILLVLESDNQLDQVLTLFIRTGYTKFAGYLVGGMQAWDNAGLPVEELGQMAVHELREAGSRLQILDVRTPSEWNQGHVPGAHHIFLPHLRDKIADLDREKPIAVYCDSGYRASIAASILKQRGFKCVCNIPGSWQAWRKGGVPIESGRGGK